MGNAVAITPQVEAEAAQQYRLAQAQRILDVFEAEHNRPVETIEELEQWVGSAPGKAALANYHDKDGHVIPKYPRSKRRRG